MRIEVRVTTKAKESSVTKGSGFVRVKTTAAPDRGKANEAVIALLAEYYDVAKSTIRIVRGHSGRTKLIEIK